MISPQPATEPVNATVSESPRPHPQPQTTSPGRNLLEKSSTSEHSNSTSSAAEEITAWSLPRQQPIIRPKNHSSSILRSHFRSRSLAELPSRIQSSPALDSQGRYVFVNAHASPSDATRSATTMDGNIMHGKMASLNVSQADDEDSTTTTAMRVRRSSPQAEFRSSSSSSPSPILAPHASTFPRSSSSNHRRHSSSPLHFHVVTGGGGGSAQSQFPSSPSSVHSSPPTLNVKYNESYPGGSVSSASSLPSTPSSMRSRSPSISSLETIADVPDAEDAATDADRAAAVKAASEKLDSVEEENSNRGREGLQGSGASTPPRLGLGRKRWSVCGAERRQDLDLETIWED